MSYWPNSSEPYFQRLNVRLEEVSVVIILNPEILLQVFLFGFTKPSQACFYASLLLVEILTLA